MASQDDSAVIRAAEEESASTTGTPSTALTRQTRKSRNSSGPGAAIPVGVAILPESSSSSNSTSNSRLQQETEQSETQPQPRRSSRAGARNSLLGAEEVSTLAAEASSRNVKTRQRCVAMRSNRQLTPPTLTLCFDLRIPQTEQAEIQRHRSLCWNKHIRICRRS